MAKPNVLCKLFKGKLVDTFAGFVDTFNYLVDFVQNLRGDGDDDTAKGIVVDRSVEDHPVLRLKDSFSVGSSDKYVVESGDNSNLAISTYDTTDSSGVVTHHFKIDVKWLQS